MAKTISTWPRETVTLTGDSAGALLGYATAVTLDGIEVVISAPTMEGLEAAYDKVTCLGSGFTPFDRALCQAIAYLPRAAVDLDL